MDDLSFFDEVIRIREQEISSFQMHMRFLLLAGGSLLLFGIVVWILVLQNKFDSTLAPSLASLVGSFVSVSSLFPYKEITPRRITLAKYRQLKKEWVKIQELPDRDRETRMKELNEYLNIFQ